jgi:hypothetical protein
MLKHWAIASLSLRDKPPVGSQRMRRDGDQADREELREKVAGKSLPRSVARATKLPYGSNSAFIGYCQVDPALLFIGNILKQKACE